MEDQYQLDSNESEPEENQQAKPQVLLEEFTLDKTNEGEDALRESPIEGTLSHLPATGTQNTGRTSGQYDLAASLEDN